MIIMNMMFLLIEIVLSCQNDNDHSGVNISIYLVTRVIRLFFGSRAKIFILVFFVQKYSFRFFSCKNIHLDSFHAKILRFYYSWFKLVHTNLSGQPVKILETFMCSCVKIFKTNGRKGRIKPVVQKYFQEMAGKRCFREVIQKYSCLVTHRGRISMKRYYPGWCRNIYFKINIHP